MEVVVIYCMSLGFFTAQNDLLKFVSLCVVAKDSVKLFQSLMGRLVTGEKIETGEFVSSPLVSNCDTKVKDTARLDLTHGQA